MGRINLFISFGSGVCLLDLIAPFLETLMLHRLPSWVED